MIGRYEICLNSLNKIIIFIAMLVVMLLFSFSVSLNAQTNDHSKEDYKLIIFSDFCYEQFFGNEKISSDCISDTISRTISILMVAFAIMNQLPQIHKIWKSQSIQGISFNAYYTELYLLSFITAYNLYKQTKFILYGENAIVGLEYSIVLSLFIFYDKNLNFHQWLFKAVFFILINTPLYIGLGPQWIFDMTIYINMSLLFMARFLQIRLNCQNRNTGQLSLLTQLQNNAGSIARLFTLFNDNADFSYMIYVLEDNIMGTILLVQIINTWRAERNKNKKSFDKSDQSTCDEIKYDQI